MPRKKTERIWPPLCPITGKPTFLRYSGTALFWLDSPESGWHSLPHATVESLKAWSAITVERRDRFITRASFHVEEVRQPIKFGDTSKATVFLRPSGRGWIGPLLPNFPENVEHWKRGGGPPWPSDFQCRAVETPLPSEDASLSDNEAETLVKEFVSS